MAWQAGEAVVRREIVGGLPWLGWMVNVVVDSPELLATYSPHGSAFHFPSGDWPTSDGRHPWHGNEGWRGNGTLMLQRPGDRYAVWLFWSGPDREFRGWYVNLESPFARTEIGFDTRDLELDLVIAPDRSWTMKDVDLLWQRHEEGRFSIAEVRNILDLGASVGRMIDSGNWWWEDSWVDWRPDPLWKVPEIPEGWHRVESPLQGACVTGSARSPSRPQSRRQGSGHRLARSTVSGTPQRG